MTSRLYLLRHGIAVPHGTPGVAEDDRPLTPKGISRVRKIATSLSWLDIEPDRIVTSPLPRARRTAEIVAEVLGLKAHLEETDLLRPRVSIGAIRDWLDGRSEDRLMVVGHNPSLNDLAGSLLGLQPGQVPFELKKAGIAEFRLGPSPGPYRLQWLATPRLLMRLANGD